MLDELVELLLEHETVDGAEVYRIVGRPVPEHRPEEVAIGPRVKALGLSKAAGRGRSDAESGCRSAAATAPLADTRPPPIPSRRHQVMELLVLSGSAVRSVLGYRRCADAMRDALAARARGEVFQPLRSVLKPGRARPG